jgi:hypothetical protein
LQDAAVVIEQMRPRMLCMMAAGTWHIAAGAEWETKNFIFRYLHPIGRKPHFARTLSGAGIFYTLQRATPGNARNGLWPALSC